MKCQGKYEMKESDEMPKLPVYKRALTAERRAYREPQLWSGEMNVAIWKRNAVSIISSISASHDDDGRCRHSC